MWLRGYWPVVLWAALILCLHIIPSDKIPKPPDWTFSVDKLVHFFLFAALSFLILRYRLVNDKGQLMISVASIVVFCTLYGFLMESVQLLVPGRKFSIIDLTADSLGAFAGNFIYLGFVKLKKVLANS